MTDMIRFGDRQEFVKGHPNVIFRDENTITSVKKSLDVLHSRLDTEEKKISKFEDKAIDQKLSKLKQKAKKIMETVICGTQSSSLTCMLLEFRRKGGTGDRKNISRNNSQNLSII